MKKVMTLVLSVLFFFLQAQNACESGRYISEVFSSYNLNSAVLYGSADPYGLVSNQDLFMDIYEPAGDTLDKRPVIIHKFGGAYAIGWRSQPNIPDFAEMYTKRGFVFISIDYRLGFNVLDGQSAERAVYRGIQDLRAALRFVAENANTYGIDTSNIFLTGTSAGSISSIGQTYMDEDDRPSSTFGILLEPSDLGCVSCSGNNLFNNQEVKIHGIINNWGAILDTSFIDIVDDPTDNVPMISFHGTNDNAVFYVEGQPFSVPLFPNLLGSFLIHERLNNQGIKNKLYPLVGYGHEPQLLAPDVADTIVLHASQFLYEIMSGETAPIIGDSTVCLNDTSIYSTPFEVGSNYCWEVVGGNIISQNQNEITIHWNTQGNHTLKVTEITKLEISKPRTLNIEVTAPIQANINYSSYDGLFNFTGNFINNASYYWEFGTGDFDFGQMVNYQYTDTGNYIVNLEIDNDFCKAYDTVTISSDICPVANFNYSTNDSSVLLTNTAQFYNNVYWNFGDGNNSNSDVNTHQYAQEGTYTIQQVVYNNYCIDTIEQTVTIYFCSKADFEVVSNGFNINLTNNSYNASSNFWNFGDGNTSGVFQPNHTYANAGTFTIELIVFDGNLCSDTLRKDIFIDEKDTNTSIFEVSGELFSIYPNPVKDVLYFDVSNKDVTQIQISNLLGEIIKEIKTDAKTINLKSLTKGIYNITFECKGKVFTKRFVKQ